METIGNYEPKKGTTMEPRGSQPDGTQHSGGGFRQRIGLIKFRVGFRAEGFCGFWLRVLGFRV